MRQFHHAPIAYNVKSGVASPKDLEGKKVGVRAYTVTTGVWVRGILATEYGVDLGKVTWVVVDEEHVQEYRKPANVLERPGANLGEMLAKGELAAAIGVGQVDSPDVKPLIPNAREAEAAWYRKTGIYPINHTVVVKDSLLRADPTLAPRLFAAFTEAKAVFLRQLASGAELSADAQALAQRRRVVGDDPLPYGLARQSDGHGGYDPVCAGPEDPAAHGRAGGDVRQRYAGSGGGRRGGPAEERQGDTQRRAVYHGARPRACSVTVAKTGSSSDPAAAPSPCYPELRSRIAQFEARDRVVATTLHASRRRPRRSGPGLTHIRLVVRDLDRVPDILQAGLELEEPCR